MAANNTTTTTTNNNNKNKKTRGRQKIEMKMIQDEDDRLITFSKRRAGIYKKASELVTLCGAEVGVVIFSPSGKPFSYGHPSIDAVSHRLLSDQPNPPLPLPHAAAVDAATQPIVEAHRRVRMNKLNNQYSELFSHLEAEKERRKEMEKLTAAETEKAAAATPEGWWDAPIEGLSLDELKRRHRSLEELHANISNHVKERMDMSLDSFNNNNNALAPGASSSFNASIGGSSSSQRSEPFVYRPTTSTGLHYPHSESGYGYGHGHRDDLGSNQQ